MTIKKGSKQYYVILNESYVARINSVVAKNSPAFADATMPVRIKIVLDLGLKQPASTVKLVKMPNVGTKPWAKWILNHPRLLTAFTLQERYAAHCVHYDYEGDSSRPGAMQSMQVKLAADPDAYSYDTSEAVERPYFFETGETIDGFTSY